MPGPALVHLVRLANGLAPFATFMDSYERHPAGREHELVLLLKGFDTSADAAPYFERAAAHRPLAVYADDAGLDLTAYLFAANRLGHRHVAFVNSFSEILVDGWLELLCSALDAPGIGAAGATGSWGANLAFKLMHLGIPGGYADVFPDRRAAARMLTEISGVPYRGAAHYGLGTLAYTLRDGATLPLFPAPHLRTNAFVIERELLLGLRVGRLRSQRATHRLESGRSSLTEQLESRGRPVVVLDRQGAARRWREWPDVDVLWQGRQQELLVADNQTRSYADGTPVEREALSRFAWGPRARPSPA